MEILDAALSAPSNRIRIWSLRQYLQEEIRKNVRILTEDAKVYHADEAKHMTDKIDVLILCGGSATDLPVQTPEYAKYFTVVDSFDTHARIPEHFAAV